MNLTSLYFEFKKMRKNHKSKLIFILSIALVGLLFAMNGWMNAEIDNSESMNIQFELESIENALLQLPDQEETKEIEEEYLVRKELLESRLASLYSDDWRTDLENQILLDESFLEGLRSGNTFGGEPLEIVESRVALSEELLRRDIEPAHETYSTKGIYFLRSLMNIFFGLGGAVLIVFLTGDILSREMEKGTIKLLFTQPTSRTSMINSKFIVAIVSSFVLLLVVSALGLLTGGVLNGLGSPAYPLLIQHGESIEFMDITKYLYQTGILFAVVIVMIIALVLLISILTNSSTISISLTILIMGLMSLGITNYGYLAEWAHLVPFTYINTSGVIDGSVANNLGNSNINLINGIIVTLLFSIVLYIFTVFLTEKKDIL